MCDNDYIAIGCEEYLFSDEDTSLSDISKNIYFCKVEGYEVKMPVKAYSTDAGIDFFIPKFNKSFKKDFDKWNRESNLFTDIDGSRIIVPPKTYVVIPTGIKCIIPKGYALVAFDKSSRAIKNKLKCSAGVIDFSYTGNILIQLYNMDNVFIDLNEGEKIIQFLLLPIELATIKYVEEDEYEKIAREYGYYDVGRLEGGLGSTGLK